VKKRIFVCVLRFGKF